MTGHEPDHRKDEPGSQNPYADNLSGIAPESVSSGQDHSVFAEPWMTKTHFQGDEYSDACQPIPDPRDIDHTVWDEPGLSQQLAGDTPENGLTWARWYEQETAATSAIDSWLVTAFLCVLSGPLAVLTAAFGFSGNRFDFVLVLFVIPAVQELLKVMLPLWVVERKPYLFFAPLQILLCAGCSGFVFGAVHPLFAVHLFGVSAFTDGKTMWMISIVAQTVCSVVAGMALVRIWSNATRNMRRPDLTDGGVLGASAIAMHIVYSLVLVLLGL